VLARPLLIRGHARLILSDSLAHVGGRGLGGDLVHAFGAPLAILFDVASYVASGFLQAQSDAQRTGRLEGGPVAGLPAGLA
jgi:hypothetical protein